MTLNEFPDTVGIYSIVMSRDQTAGRSHGMKIGNSSFERVEDFKNLGKPLTNQNSI
jgi:hypothetical protein